VRQPVLTIHRYRFISGKNNTISKFAQRISTPIYTLIPFKRFLFVLCLTVYLFYTFSLYPRIYIYNIINNTNKICFSFFFGTHHAERDGKESFSNKKQIKIKK